MDNLVEERFWSKVDKSGDCWLWMGGRTKRKKYKEGTKFRGNYGAFFYKNKQMKAHRVSYMFTFGEIPDGMCVCHSCDNPPCVRPNHLFIATQAENLHDRERKGRTFKDGGKKGAENCQAKLSPVDVVLIRELLKTQTSKAIADWLGVGTSTIYRIKSGKGWRSVA